jgi:hypothetical protein
LNCISTRFSWARTPYGVTAAAQTYFNKTLDELTLHEAAFLAALPQAPSELSPVRAPRPRDGAAQLRAGRNGTRTATFTLPTHDAARDLPLLTVQSGDFTVSARRCRRATISPTRSGASFPAALAKRNSSPAGCRSARPFDPTCRSCAAHALQRALEQYDRGLGRWRGTGETIPPRIWATKRHGARRWPMLRTGARRDAWQTAGIPPWCWRSETEQRGWGSRGADSGFPSCRSAR